MRSCHDLSFSRFRSERGGGVPHSLNDQYRRRFSLDSPFEGGFEATLGISVVIYILPFGLPLDLASTCPNEAIFSEYCTCA